MIICKCHGKQVEERHDIYWCRVTNRLLWQVKVMQAEREETEKETAYRKASFWGRLKIKYFNHGQ